MPYEVQQNPGTGPYRRVFSRPGFAYASAQVILPPATDVQEFGAGLDQNGQPVVPPNHDEGYIYLGGWGDHGGAADAGLIHSPAFGHWSVFMSCEGIGMHVDPTNTNLMPGQTVFLEFFVPNDNVIKLNVTGRDGNGDLKVVTMSLQTPEGQGWNADGSGVIMKRMTTIGQAPEDLHSGSYVRNIHWLNCNIGQDHASATPWVAQFIGGYHTFPQTGQVQIEYVSPSEETDTISLA